MNRFYLTKKSQGTTIFPISESSNIITKIGLGDILIAGSDGQINAPGPAGQSERRE